jgi:(hydroxyamino)benzene mutase
VENRVTRTSIQRALVVAGAILFLLGLLQGAAVQMFTNPRMALSAHLTAVQSGTALMVVGVVWPFAALRQAWRRFSASAITCGIYGLWAGLTLAAAAGASNTLPMAGAGYRASGIVEMGVSALVLVSSALMTAGWVVFVFGLVSAKRH